MVARNNELETQLEKFNVILKHVGLSTQNRQFMIRVCFVAITNYDVLERLTSLQHPCNRSFNAKQAGNVASFTNHYALSCSDSVDMQGFHHKMTRKCTVVTIIR